MKRTVCLVIVLSIVSSVLASACVIDTQPFTFSNEDRYLVSFSNSDCAHFSNGIAVVNSSADMREFTLNTSSSVEHALATGGKYYFYSDDLDVHYCISEGELNTLHLLGDEGRQTYAGVLAAFGDNANSIQFINIGYQEDSYVMKIVISGERNRSITVKNRYLCASALKGNRLYVSAVDLLAEAPDGNSIGRSVIETYDLESEQLCAEIALPERYRNEPFYRLSLWNGQIVLYTNSLDRYGAYDGASHIGLYDPETHTIVNEFTIKDAPIADLYVYDGKLYVIDEYGGLYRYESGFSNEQKNNLLIDGSIRKIHFRNGEIHIATIDDEGQIRISAYNLKTSATISKINVPIPVNIDWDYENFEFLPV